VHPDEFERRLDNPMTLGRLDAPCRGPLDQDAQECRECLVRRGCAEDSGLNLDAYWPECAGDCDGCGSERCADRVEEEDG